MGHSTYFSPSSLSRRIKCRGSAFLEANIVEEGPKPAADWGSYAHHIAAEYLKIRTALSAHYQIEMFGQLCDDEMIDCVSQYLSDVKELQSIVPVAIKSVEKQFDLSWLGHPDVFGTCDLCLDSLFDCLAILDLKTGTVPVYPENNAQLYTYALMAAGQGISTYRSIIVAISQPRGKYGEKSLSMHEITPKELLDWYHAVLRPTIEAIESGDRTLTAGEDQCRYCKAVNVCPEYTRHVSALAKVDFTSHTPAAPVIDDELVTRVYPHLGMLKDWIKRVEGHAYGMATRDELPGYKLVAGRKSRDWADEQAAKKLLEELDIDPYTHKLLSPAQAEKALGKQKKLLQGIISVSVGNPVIVPAADKREATSTAAIDFANVDQ